MKIIKLFIGLLTAQGIFYACSSPSAKSVPTHQVKFINGSSNNRLEVLDWGGAGKSIIFLTGLGNSAHIYDAFAPRFTDQFHVYALTRRGFGSSAQPATGYDINVLTRDILAVIDSLHLDKVILIGHSIAGDEITKFASTYPGRVDKIIYLEAAYDNLNIGSLITNGPEAPGITTEDSSSFGHLQQFIEKMNGVSYPDEETRNLCIFSKEGRYLKDVTPDSVIGEIVKGIRHPDSGYALINTRALAIYSSIDSAKQCFSYYPLLDSSNKLKADSTFSIIKNWARGEQDRFKNGVKNGIVKTIKGGYHYIFLSNPIETEEMIRAFLK